MKKILVFVAVALLGLSSFSLALRAKSVPSEPITTQGTSGAWSD